MSQNETEKTEKYAFFYKRLLHSTHIVRQDTGEEIEIPPETETLYSYMRDQYESYRVREKPFFESHESMGLKFKGRCRRWIAARIEVLNRLGLVKSEEQKRDSYGHKRFHHTVISLEEVSDNLLFYGPASISGGILAEGMLIRPLKKKKPRGTPKKKKVAAPLNEENKGDDEQAQQQEHEQQSPGVSPTAIYSESKPVQRADGVASLSATDDPEQHPGVPQSAGDSCDDIPSDDDAVNQDEIAIFDENNVVTEAFINGADNPRIGRNDDGTVQNYRYTYARAKTAQAFQDGYASPQAISDSWSIWFNAARPEYIPVHLLPVHERPVLAGYFDDDEEF
nr:hypothetical protein [Klebsiella variicola]